jgi:hypothetical protein
VRRTTRCCTARPYRTLLFGSARTFAGKALRPQSMQPGLIQVNNPRCRRELPLSLLITRAGRVLSPPTPEPASCHLGRCLAFCLTCAWHRLFLPLRASLAPQLSAHSLTVRNELSRKLTCASTLLIGFPHLGRCRRDALSETRCSPCHANHARAWLARSVSSTCLTLRRDAPLVTHTARAALTVSVAAAPTCETRS